MSTCLFISDLHNFNNLESPVSLYPKVTNFHRKHTHKWARVLMRGDVLEPFSEEYNIVELPVECYTATN